MADPITSFKQFKTQQSQDRMDREVSLWEKWKHAPDHEKPDHLEPLLHMYEPTFQKKLKEYKPPAVQRSALKADLQRHFIDALHSFDPVKASLSTHVEMRLQKSLRFVNKMQNVGYIPEGQSQHIGRIQGAQDELTETFGRPPTVDEIADHLGLQPKKVQTVLKAVRKDFAASSLEFDDTSRGASREQEVLSLLPMSLSNEERQVFEYIYGQGGKPKVTETGRIADLIGKSPSQVSRLRTSILDKYNRYK